MNIKEKLKWDKIKINWNKNPIKMPTFLSFLMVEVTKSNDHLGSLTGWTLYYNKNLNLEIHGGWVNDIEYLDGLEYGNKLYSKWNNLCSLADLYRMVRCAECLREQPRGFHGRKNH